MPFAAFQPAELPSGEIVQLPAPLLKLSLNRSDPTCIDTGILIGPLATSEELMVIVSLKLPVPLSEVSGLTLIVPGAVPECGFNPSQLLVVAAVQLSEPVPALVTCTVCGFGFNPDAPKNVRLDGAAARTADLTARVTEMVRGELLAPGAESVMFAV